MFHLGGVRTDEKVSRIHPLFFHPMIIFNTLKKAQHYVKHRAVLDKKDDWYNDGEHFSFYDIKDDMVLHVFGWRCGCGCDRGDTSASVIGRIKSPKS